MKTIIEPFRIKVVEPIRMTTRAEREKVLQDARMNVFMIKAKDVPIHPPTHARLASRDELDGVGEVGLEDDWSGIRLKFGLEPAAGFWRFPIETVSQSEDGFERNYQASCLLFHWRLTLAPAASGTITVRIGVSHASR